MVIEIEGGKLLRDLLPMIKESNKKFLHIFDEGDGVLFTLQPEEGAGAKRLVRVWVSPVIEFLRIFPGPLRVEIREEGLKIRARTPYGEEVFYHQNLLLKA